MAIKYSPDYVTITTTNDDGTETVETSGAYSVDSAADLEALFAMFGVDSDDE